MTSLCLAYWQAILAQGLVIGVGNGCLFVPSTAVIQPYFTNRRALAMGIAITGGNVGGVIYSSVFEILQPSIGFAWATRTIAFIQLATLVIPISVLQMRFKPTQARRLFDTTAWKDSRYSVFACASLVGYIGLYIPWFYANSFAISKKVVNGHLAVYLVSILNAGSFFGRITLTYAADKVGPVNMLLVCFIGSAVLAFGWIGVTSTAGAIIFCLLYGCFSGALISLVLTVIAAILCPEMSAIGVRIGMICIFCSVGILVGSPLGGLILHNGWVSLETFAGAMLLAGACGISAVRFLTVGTSLYDKC